MSINFDSVCRLCMIQTDSMIQLFNNDYNLPNKIMVLIPTLQIHIDDNLPMQICHRCVDQINNFESFKLQCEKSNLILNDRLHAQQLEKKSLEKCFNGSPVQVIKSDSSISDEQPDKNKELEDNSKKEDKNEDKMYSEAKEENVEEYNCEVILSEEDVKFSVSNENQLKDDTDMAKTFCTNKAIVPPGKITVTCSMCGKSMAKRRYNEHMKTHSSDRPFKCYDCGKTFTLRDGLRKHSLVHSDDKVHMCDVCGKRFKFMSGLKLHHVTHTGQKPHICDVCGKGFSQLGSFKTHKLLHLGVKPFNCDICGKSYSQKNTLQIHLAVHGGEKQHFCNICGKGFLHKGNLRTHMIVHSGERKFSCEVCGMSYTKRHNLRKHKKSTGHQGNLI